MSLGPPLDASVPTANAAETRRWAQWSAVSVAGVLLLIVALNGLASVVHLSQDIRALITLIGECVLVALVLTGGSRAAGDFAAFRHAVGLRWPNPSDLRAWLWGLGAQIVAVFAFAAVVHLIDPHFNAGQASNTIGLHNADPTALILVGIAAVLLAPVAEECQFRGLLLRAGVQYAGFPAAAVVSSALFGALHGYEARSLAGDAYLAAHMMVFGLVQCLVVRRYRTLTPAVLVHFTFNAFVLIVVAT